MTVARRPQTSLGFPFSRLPQSARGVAAAANMVRGRWSWYEAWGHWPRCYRSTRAADCMAGVVPGAWTWVAISREHVGWRGCGRCCGALSSPSTVRSCIQWSLVAEAEGLVAEAWWLKPGGRCPWRPRPGGRGLLLRSGASGGLGWGGGVGLSAAKASGERWAGRGGLGVVGLGRLDSGGCRQGVGIGRLTVRSIG